MSTTTQAAPAQQQLAVSRMSLKSIRGGRRQAPKRIVLYGVEKVGKSTFAADAPTPVFIAAEDGINHLDVKKFDDPMPETWRDILDAIRALEREPHEYKTLVVDTLDWMEPLIWRHICQRDEQPNIEGYGYGKGYVAALDEWRIFLAALERVWRLRGMHIVLLAHSLIKTWKNPEGEDYDRYNLKINEKAAGLVKEWADVILFANHETVAKKDVKTKRVRGVSTGARLIYTTRTAAYDAGNRDSLPEQLPLSWADYWAAVQQHAPAEPAVIIAEIERKAKELGGADGESATAAIGRANGDVQKLVTLNNWVNAKLAEKGS